MVLLNPVVDFRKTRLEAVLPWRRGLFNESSHQELEKTGVLPLELGFRMRIEMVLELCMMRPNNAFAVLELPLMRATHGNQDTRVPYAITKAYTIQSSNVTFHTIVGSDHTFHSDEAEKKYFHLICNWFYGNSYKSEGI